MIELEIQAFSERREGLLVQVGRLAATCGFILQRQRLVQDPNGALLTMVVCGPSRKRRELQAALENYERIISFELEPFVEGEPRPHFAASRPIAGYTPPPVPQAAAPAPARVPSTLAPVVAAVVAPVAAPAVAEPAIPIMATMPAAVDAAPMVIAVEEPESFDDWMIQRRPSPPRPAEPAPAPFVEPVALEADAPAVEQALAGLAHAYPRILPQLLALDRAVAAGARESSLRLAGQRVGAWLFEREYALDTGLGLDEALDALGVPALHAFVEVERRGSQLHLLHSPLCAQHGHSGCGFFGGFLEGLLGPAIAPDSLSIFPVCCRSYGAEECVFAVSE